MTLPAKAMFRSNEFPDELIEGPPSNANTPQPDSKEKLLHSLLRLKEEINRIAGLISTSISKGKTKHPGYTILMHQNGFSLPICTCVTT